LDPLSGGSLGICWIRFVDEVLRSPYAEERKKLERERRPGAQDGHAVAVEAVRKVNGGKVGADSAKGGREGMVRVELDGEGKKCALLVSREIERRKPKKKPQPSASRPQPSASRPHPPSQQQPRRPNGASAGPGNFASSMAVGRPDGLGSFGAAGRGSPIPVTSVYAPRSVGLFINPTGQKPPEQFRMSYVSQSSNRLPTSQPKLRKQQGSSKGFSVSAAVTRKAKKDEKARARVASREEDDMETDSSEESSSSGEDNDEDDEAEAERARERDKVFFPRAAGLRQLGHEPSTSSGPLNAATIDLQGIGASSSVPRPGSAAWHAEKNARFAREAAAHLKRSVMRKLAQNGRPHLAISKSAFSALEADGQHRVSHAMIELHFRTFRPQEASITIPPRKQR
jgi:hypothetical protein